MLVHLQSNVLAKVVAFFYDVIIVKKKVPVEKKSELSRGGATFLAFSLSFLSSRVDDNRNKLYMVGTYSTVEKRAKRMPDATVETAWRDRVVVVVVMSFISKFLFESTYTRLFDNFSFIQ